MLAASERGRHVATMADAQDDPLESELGDQRVELFDIAVAALRVAGEDEADVVEALRLESARGLDQHFLALPCGEPRGDQNDALVRLNAPDPP